MRRILGRPVVVVAFIVLALALLHPPHGTGVNLCLWHGMTDMPCPGCGMSRSVSCAARGMLAESWSYHPFGVVVITLLALVALFTVLPGAWRRAVMRRMLERSRVVTSIYAMAVAAFIAFGVARIIAMLV